MAVPQVHHFSSLDGMLKSALLFHKKHAVDLENFRFWLNPYDPCMANMLVNGSQMMMTWHVDDLKVSHKNISEITIFAIYLYKSYGKITLHHDKIHNYLGMTMD